MSSSSEKWKRYSFSHVQLFATLWTVAHQALHGILQPRILEWVAISFARGSFWTRDQTWVSYIASIYHLSYQAGEPYVDLNNPIYFSTLYPCINSFLCVYYLVFFKALPVLVIGCLSFLQEVKGMCTHLSVTVSSSILSLFCSVLLQVFPSVSIILSLSYLLTLAAPNCCWNFKHTERLSWLCQLILTLQDI